MPTVNPVKRLKDAHPGTEIWWDSSPLVYADWVKSLDHSAFATELFQLTGEVGRARQFKPDSLLQGSTTNQPLTWQVIEKDPQTWGDWAATQVQKEPGLEARELMWRLFIEVAARGADLLCPIFNGSNFRCGQICCQVDPRDLTDLAAMLTQARRISAARPNIMVKMPGSREGIEGVKILTQEGIPTNVTLAFTVAQLVATGEAAQAGVAEARRRGTDLKYWRSCATMMLGRFEDAPPLKAQARELGIELSEPDLRWAGVAIFRKVHKLFRERGYPTKLLAASMRLGPSKNGVMSIWHLEKLAGADAVLSLFPNILESWMTNYGDRPIEPQVEQAIPDDVMERLLRIPYFAQAFDEKGIAPEDFGSHPALQATARSFAESMQRVEQFAAQFTQLPPDAVRQTSTVDVSRKK